MESLLAINVWEIGKDDEHAIFAFPNFPYVDNECEYAVAGMLEVQIDMITKGTYTYDVHPVFRYLDTLPPPSPHLVQS